MIKKITILAVLILILSLGGFFLWLKISTKNIKSVASSQTVGNQPSPKNNIPKIDKFKIPILMYHYIRNAEEEDELGKKLSVSPENFYLQLKWLKENNYETIKLSELADPEKKFISKIYFDKKNPIALTFDDGYEDAYIEAFPILKELGFIGTFYIIQGYVGGGNYMSQSEIDELQKAGNEIGSHSLTHPDLVKIAEEVARRQISDSKKETITFCYPSGKYNQTIIEMVKKSGYLAAVTTKPGFADQNSNLFELPRIRIENGDGNYLAQRLKAYE